MADLLHATLGGCSLDEFLGSGGMAAVYKATRLSDGQRVAVKVLAGKFKVSPDFIKRFEREAMLMESFDHPNILPVYDFGRTDDLTYLVMALLPGGSLKDYLERHRLRLAEMVILLGQIAGALDYAHERGVIHRDLKPSNILMDAEGKPYLADFGIAKFKEESIGLTASGMLIGTPGYMAPEQWRAEPVTAQTDIYAFGVMIFEVLSGRLPFDAETPFSLMYRHLDEPPPAISRLRGDLPATIDRVLKRAMAKVPEQRYATATSVIEAMEIALAQDDTRPSRGREQTEATWDGHTFMMDAHTTPLTLDADISERKTLPPTNYVVSDEHRKTVTPLDFPSLDDEPSSYNAVDVGARTLLERAKEAEREFTGSAAFLAEQVVRYVQDLREQAKRKPAAEESPYRALESYDLADTKLFYGREEAIDAMLARSPFARFTVLHAESGAGKTSLLRAGLMPRLLAGGFLPLYIAVRRRPPHEAIKAILLTNPAAAPDLAGGSLRTYLRDLSRIVGEKREIFIFIDQFETFLTDVFTEDQRHEFVHEIAECLDDELLPVRITLAMRTEYFGLLSRFQPGIPQPFAHEFLLRALTTQEAKRALVLPARSQGYDFAPELPERILADLGGSRGEIAPPQLQLVGGALIETLPEERKKITDSDYDEAGRAEGVLRGYLERLLERFLPEQRRLARLVIEGLVRADQTRDVRTLESLRAEIDALGVETHLLEEVMTALRENRVLRLVEVEHGVAYELVHDYLALQVQLDPATTARKAAQELLDRRVGDFEKFGSLLTEQELGVIRSQLDQLRVSDTARALIDHTEAQRRKQQRRTLILITAAVLGLIGALALGLFAAIRESQNQQERAEIASTSQARIAAERDAGRLTESRRLADSAMQQLNLDPVTSLNLAIEALVPRERPYLPEAEFALSRAVQHVTERLYLPSDNRVYGAIWNADNALILTWSEDGTARIFDSASGEEKLRVGDSESGAILASWSPDETRLVVGYRNGRVVVYDAVSGDLLLAFEEHTAALLGIQWRGTQILSWGEDGLAILWDAQTGTPLTRIQVDSLRSAVWSPEQTTILTIGAALQIWDAETGEELRGLEGHVNRIHGAVWNQEGTQILSYSDDRKAIVWDAQTGEILFMLEGHTDVVTSASWSPDESMIITADFGGLAIVWDAQTGEERLRIAPGAVIDGANWKSDSTQVVFYGEEAANLIWDVTTGDVLGNTADGSDTVYNAVWSPDEQRILTYTQNGWLHLWDAGRKVLTLAGHEGAVSSAVWSTDGSRVLSAGRDGSARVWAVDSLAGTGTERLMNAAERGEVFRALWSVDESQIVTAHADGSLVIWDAGTGESSAVLEGHTDSVRFLVWSPDHTRLLSGSDDTTVRVWDAETEQEIAALTGHSAALTSVSWNSDAAQVLTTSEDGTARVWDTHTGEEMLQIGGYSSGVWGAAWNHAETTIATVGADGTLRLWDAAAGEKLLEITVGDHPVLGVVWSHDDSRLLVWGYDTFAHIYDARTGMELVRMAGHSDWVVTAMWNADESQVVTTSSDGTARLWDAETGEPLQQFTGHEDSVIRAVWNHDQSRLMTASADGTVRVWDVRRGQEVLRLDRHTDRVRSAFWNQSETRILTASDDGTIRISFAWPDVDALLETAYTLQTRSLTAKQRSAFFLP
ncbi:MAG: protein kinase [Anaerolineae bacterium]|nr:protein kinase [Anaerolineae bacterium]